MKKETYIENVPTWALGLLVNDDNQGLSVEDCDLVAEFTAGLGTAFTSYGEAEFFSWYPAFGLPCLCVEATITKFVGVTAL